jgi:uncharacterized protein (UPF0548 family)
MPRRAALPRPFITAAVWPVGVGLTSWHYMWRTTPLHRRELAGSLEEDGPPPLPAEVSHDAVQLAENGVGALFHRRYRARLRGGRLSAEQLIASVMADPDRLAPTEFARFIKVKGEDGSMRMGDEYVVRMPGPWNGPVRVVSVTPTSFRLVTLEGHLEAGQIEFRSSSADGGDLIFTIESWASSGDRLSKVLYQHVRMAKEVQFHMWTSFLENAARVSGSRLAGGVDVETRRVDRSGGTDGPPLTDPRAKRILDALHQKSLNFSLERRNELTADEGWHLDNYRQPLQAEAPGDPVVSGTFEVARRLMRDYEFADPAIVRAVYYPDRPLEERDMLLEARFWGLRFHLGVRIGGVVDETRCIEGREVRVWGWNYRTLQGHLEMGQMDFEVWKWLDSGEVEFRIAALSRAAEIRNPLVRFGFRLFGRREQVKFARHACERMARLTAAALAEGGAGEVPPTGQGVQLRPASRTRRLGRKLEHQIRAGR